MTLRRIVGSLQRWMRSLLHFPRVIQPKLNSPTDARSPANDPSTQGEMPREPPSRSGGRPGQTSRELTEGPPGGSNPTPPVTISGSAVEDGGEPDVSASDTLLSGPSSDHFPDGLPVETGGDSSNDPEEDSKSEKARDEEQKRKAPANIGPRRTRSTSRTKEPRSEQLALRPEVICRRASEGLSWEVVLVAGDRGGLVEVHQDGTSLNLMDGECRLPSFRGLLSVVFETDERHEVLLCDDKPMIFKFRTNWTGDGRMVKCATKGYFIIIAPNEWNRTGRVRVKPEGCTDADFTAHYFFGDMRDQEDDFGGFRECEIAPVVSGFDLVGEQVFDDSENGDLYVGSVPSLKCSNAIVWARIGEELENGWKGENFNPRETSLSEVLKERQGRFFVRIYDDEGLVDSGEFRYLQDLKEIRVNGERYVESTLLVPPLNGYQSTRVSIIGTGKSTIRPVIKSGERHARAIGGDLLVDPHPNGDFISCEIQSDSGCVDIELKLPRVWWRVSRGGTEPGEWHDTALVMTRQGFRDHTYTNSALWLRLPRRITKVRVGFNHELNRVYPHGSGESNASIPLTDFVDYSQIDQQLDKDTLFRVECGEAVLSPIRIPADPVPAIISFAAEPDALRAGATAKLRWQTRNAEPDSVAIEPGVGAVESSGSVGITPRETMNYTLKLKNSGVGEVTKAITVTVLSLMDLENKPAAWVKRTGGGWKRGKGFSYGEFRAAGVTVAFETCGSMPADRRRRSVHPANIDTIRGLLDA